MLIKNDKDINPMLALSIGLISLSYTAFTPNAKQPPRLSLSK